jgi:hypothetical protein
MNFAELEWKPIDTIPRRPDGSTAVVMLGFIDLGQAQGKPWQYTTMGKWRNTRRIKCWETWHGRFLDGGPIQVTHWAPIPGPPAISIHEARVMILGEQRANEIADIQS